MSASSPAVAHGQPSTHPPNATAQQRFTVHAASASAARAFARSILDGWSAGACADDVLQVVSELITNAAVASPSPQESVLLRLTTTGPELVIEQEIITSCPRGPQRPPALAVSMAAACSSSPRWPPVPAGTATGPGRSYGQPSPRTYPPPGPPRAPRRCCQQPEPGRPGAA